MNDNSQNGETAVVRQYFNRQADRDGIKTLLDIGANDGVTLSNSIDFIREGWTAVLVEPAAAPFSKLQLLHGDNKNVLLINAAIMSKDGPVDFYDSGTHLKKGDTSLLSTTLPEEMDRWKRSGEQFTKTTCGGITMATLIKRCGKSRFDYISIDCEGQDYAVLTQIELSSMGCRCLCIETNSKDDAKFVRYANRHGMRLHWKSQENLIFVR